MTGLQPATEYRFTVSARDAAGNESPPSPGLTVLTAPRPGAPTLTARYLNLDWSPGDNQIRPGIQLDNSGAAPVSLQPGHRALLVHPRRWGAGRQRLV